MKTKRVKKEKKGAVLLSNLTMKQLLTMKHIIDTEIAFRSLVPKFTPITPSRKK